MSEKTKEYIPTTTMGKQPMSLNPNHIFVDTNVLIGAYSGDARFQAGSECLHHLSSRVRIIPQ